MASAEVISHHNVPGLHRHLTWHDMRKSSHLKATTRSQMTPINPITELKALLKSFGVQGKFGFHLVHGHVKMADDMIMLGKRMHRLPGVWSRPVKADRLDVEAIHGYVFVLGSDGGLHPYEFREGQPPQMSQNDNAFLEAAKAYLERKGLTGLIGIQLLDQRSLGKEMKEFVLSDTDGTVMLPVGVVKPTDTYRITGWNAVDGVTETAGETHAKTVRGTHQVFTSGKALPDIESDTVAESIILEGLRDSGVIE